MWAVIVGQGRSTIGRWCQDRHEAEGWARQLINAGITPVKINGELFEPGSDVCAELTP